MGRNSEPSCAPRPGLPAAATASGRPADGLGRRYFFKLGVSLLSWPLNVAVQLISARSLGPSAFGSYTFLSSFFTNASGFLDAGTSSAFYAKLCARPQERGWQSFYWRAALVVFGVALILVTVAASSRAGASLWPAQPASWIVLAALFAFATWFAGLGEKVVDAHGLTASGEPVRLLIKVLTFVAVAGLFLGRWLDVRSLLLAQTGLLVVQLGFWERLLRQRALSLCPPGRVARDERNAYVSELWTYSRPLVLYTAVSTGGAIVDRWLLQYFCGGGEQGLYGLSVQVGAVCILFTGAIIPLLVRELSQAHHAGDQSRMRTLFRASLPRFYCLAALAGVFLAVQADHVAVVVGGRDFAAATGSMALMCLYPIHQTYGQLTSSVFYATGQTRAYCSIGLVNTGVGLLVTYLLVAPVTHGGMALGAAGLAGKMVIIQLIFINVQLWHNCRFLGLSFRWFVRQQAQTVVVLAGIAFAARATSAFVSSDPLLGLAGAAVIYGPLSLIAVIQQPGWFGLQPDDMVRLKGFILRVIRARSV